MKIPKFEEKIALPEGVTGSIEDGTVILKSKDVTVSKALPHRKISITSDGNSFTVSFTKGTRNEKRIANTFSAHIKNLIQGVTKGHVYKLKICSGHFPINVAVKGEQFTVNNFLGEKVARNLKLKPGVTVKIEGDIITVTSNQKELASQTAADIERTTMIRGRDLRIFQDGIYIIDKDGEPI